MNEVARFKFWKCYYSTVVHNLYNFMDAFQRVHLYLSICTFFYRVLIAFFRFFRGTVPQKLKKHSSMRNGEDSAKRKRLKTENQIILL